MEDKHGREEDRARRAVRIFGRFLAASGVPVSPSSVQPMTPPHPDIRCGTNGGTTVGFELTEAVYQKTRDSAGALTDRFNALDWLRERLSAQDRAEFDQRFWGADLCFHFAGDLPKAGLKDLTEKTFTRLLRHPE